MYKHRLVILFLFSLTFATCKKAGNSDVSGTVTEKGTGLPFPGVKVFVERTTKSGLNSNLDRTIVASTVTDANGHYELDFYMKANYLYDLYATLLEDSNGKTYSKVEWADIPKKNIVANFQLPPIAYLKVNMHKSSTIITHAAYLTIDNSASYTLSLPNYPFDSVAGIYRVISNDTAYISWSQKYGSPASWLNDNDKVYLNKGDTLDYHIYFN